MKARRHIACRIVFVMSFLLLGGCEDDYDITKKLRDSYRSRVVLNSIISPDQPVGLELFWSIRYDMGNEWYYKPEYKPVTTFTAEFYEDGRLVGKYDGSEGELDTEFLPSEGHTYKWVVTVPDYGQVSAETEIPRPAITDIRFVKQKNDFFHFEISRISMTDSRRAVWIRGQQYHGDEHGWHINDYYTNSPFPDQINTYIDSFQTNDSEASVSYEEFIRIPRINTVQACPFAFSFECSLYIIPPIDIDSLPVDENGLPIWYDEHGNPTWEEPDPVDLSQVHVRVTTPSDDYDKYFRALYKQDLFNYGADIPFFSENVHIHSNIENGIGIFAGYTTSSFIYETEN